MEKYKPFSIDTSKINTDEKSENFKKTTIEYVLNNKKKKTAFGVGDLVTTLEGPYAHTGLLVVGKKENDMIRFDDYHEAFKVALIEEQNIDLANPQ